MLTGTQFRRLTKRNRSVMATISLVFLCHSLLTRETRAQAGSSQLSSTAARSSNSASTAGRAPQITYSNGLLTVAVDNASLSQVVHKIAQQTGMKVTGRVPEDRVFGTYGPGSPSAVLTSLLDGSGSNLLIVQDASHMATELILSPRVGGATPPNPNAQYADDAGAAPAPQPASAFTPPPPTSPVLSNSRSSNRAGTGGVDTNPAATSPSSTSQQIAFPPIDASTPPAAATTTPTSPDASPATVKTPQQIFEQLQKLRQQQAQQPQTPNQ